MFIEGICVIRRAGYPIPGIFVMFDESDVKPSNEEVSVHIVRKYC